MVDLAFGMRKPVGAALMAVLVAGCMHAATPMRFTPPHPRSGSEVRKEMGTALESGDRATLTRRAMELAYMGGSLSEAALDRIEPLLDPAIIRAAHWPRLKGEGAVPGLRHWLAANGTANLYANPDFAQVPAEYRLVEGIAWDARTKRLFVGTVVEGRLAYRDAGGAWHEVPLGSPRSSLFGIVIDAPRRLLWIATGSLDQTAVPGERMTGLIALDLDRLAVVRRVPIAPGGKGAVGDLAIAADGTVYATNVLSGAIHRCAPGCAVMEDWKPAGSLPNPQGLAFSRDGSMLYIADYKSGLWVHDLELHGMDAIQTGEPVMLEGIDGLIMSPRGTLIAIQNGTRPRRIVEIALDRGGRRIASITVLAHFRPEDGEATLGVLRAGEGDMLFVADSQWERYGAGGAVTGEKETRPTRIGRITFSKTR